jgi:molybdenum cofactor cytidylyltransferase
MPEVRVAAVVLAAGASTRMGRNKLLLAIDGGVDEVVVVLGHDEERVRAELSGLSCVSVVNPDHAEGAGTSVRTGVRRAAGVDALIVVLADMPFVTADMIATLVRRYRTTRAPLVVSHYGDVQAPPTLYDRALFNELLAIPGERCAKQVVREHEAEAEVVQWPAAALRDIDVPADYDDVRADLARD